MAYNHGKAERKWKLWKEKEEKILRDSGVSEDMIEAIRLYDRQAFNSDRRYYERVQETGTYLDTVAASTDQAEPKTVQDFLDRIENQELYHVLITVDRLTLQIIPLTAQIAGLAGLYPIERQEKRSVRLVKFCVLADDLRRLLQVDQAREITPDTLVLRRLPVEPAVVADTVCHMGICPGICDLVVHPLTEIDLGNRTPIIVWNQVYPPGREQHSKQPGCLRHQLLGLHFFCVPPQNRRPVKGYPNVIQVQHS